MFFARLLSAEPTFDVQITLAVLHAVAWQFAVRRLAVRVIAPWIMRRPWAARYRRRCYRAATPGHRAPALDLVLQYDSYECGQGGTVDRGGCSNQTGTITARSAAASSVSCSTSASANARIMLSWSFTRANARLSASANSLRTA